jgi:hypothetical protein
MAEDPHLIPRVRQTLAWYREGVSLGPAMLAVLAHDAAALLALLAAKDDLIRGLCDRVEAQSQLLSKRAEK